MNIISQIKEAFTHYLISHFNVDQKTGDPCALILNVDEKKAAFGDLNTNAALVLAKKLGRNPREIAQEITETFKHPSIEKIEIAGPGFINLFLKLDAFSDLTKQLIEQKETFFKLDPDQPRRAINIEFVSANPTGPLHFGHGRGGVIGDVFGNVTRFLGHDTTKEFYINDAGSQMQKLGASFKARCLQKLGQSVDMPEDGYRGDYLIELAKECAEEYGNDLLQKDDTFFSTYAKDKMLARIKKRLQDYGITFDTWFSEKTLHDSGAINQAIEILQQNGCLYEKNGALWFKSTEFGDDKDRVIKKSTGEWTYAAADIAYLLNKVERGAQEVAFVLGHDHHSYAIRLENIRRALKLDKTKLDVILYQLVRMKEAGELVQMSKRTGKMITLDDVIKTVGADVARFFYLHSKADAQLEFDLELALKQTNENPVYYVQYAYVRTKSILAKAQEHKELENIKTKDINPQKEDLLLIKKIASLKAVLESIDRNHQTHLLTYYIIELADMFHRYYSTHRIIDMENIEQSRSRLALITLLRNTFGLALTLLGVSRPERM